MLRITQPDNDIAHAVSYLFPAQPRGVSVHQETLAQQHHLKGREPGYFYVPEHPEEAILSLTKLYVLQESHISNIPCFLFPDPLVLHRTKHQHQQCLQHP